MLSAMQTVDEYSRITVEPLAGRWGRKFPVSI